MEELFIGDIVYVKYGMTVDKAKVINIHGENIAVKFIGIDIVGTRKRENVTLDKTNIFNKIRRWFK